MVFVFAGVILAHYSWMMFCMECFLVCEGSGGLVLQESYPGTLHMGGYCVECF